MQNLLDHSLIQPFKHSILPVNGGLWLTYRLQVNPPFTLFYIQLMVHQKHTQHIELVVVRSLVVEQLVVASEEGF